MSRVLLLIKGLGRGGAEQLLVNAAPYHDRSRFSYEVAYLLPWKDALVPDLRRAGMVVHCLDAAGGMGWIRRLRRLVTERDIELLHVHTPYPAIGARSLVRRRGLPLVYTEHNVWERYRAATYWGNAATYSRNDHVFAVSNQVRQSVRYPWPLRWKRMPPVETLYHGPDPDAVAHWGAANGVREELGIPEGVPVVGTVANFKAHKGYAVLVRAAARVRRDIPDVRFVFVGSGPLERHVRRQVHDLGLERTVLFAGSRDDVPRVAAMFDVFVLASRQEGLAIALIEAMSLGKPAVVTRVGGLPEVVEHGREALLVAPGDAPALAQGIVTLVRDPSLRSAFGRAARERARHFDIRTAVRRMEEVYARLLP